MTKQIKENIFEEAKENIISLFDSHLLKIILYGSYARNDETNESDIDFMVLTDLNEKNIKKLRDKIIDIIVELSIKYNTVLSIKILNINHFNKYLEILPFYKNINKEGVVLYEK